MPRDRGRASVSRLITVGAALVCAGCVLGLGAGRSLDATAASVDTSTLTITYITPTSLRVTLDDGTVVGTGSVVPAGYYAVRVVDDPKVGDTNPNITISGPGVDLSSNLQSGMGIPDVSGFGPYTLQTSSSYAIEDSNVGASSLVTFTTTSTSTAGESPATGSTGASSAPSGPAAVMGSTLAASVSSSGVATLMLDGKAVKQVSPGLYMLTIQDRSRRAGFILERISKRAVTISTAGAVGKHSLRVMLTAGKWFFEASAKGPRSYFSVVA